MRYTHTNLESKKAAVAKLVGFGGLRYAVLHINGVFWAILAAFCATGLLAPPCRAFAEFVILPLTVRVGKDSFTRKGADGMLSLAVCSCYSVFWCGPSFQYQEGNFLMNTLTE
jgi:hypothetical protein